MANYSPWPGLRTVVLSPTLGEEVAFLDTLSALLELLEGALEEPLLDSSSSALCPELDHFELGGTHCPFWGDFMPLE